MTLQGLGLQFNGLIFIIIIYLSEKNFAPRYLLVRKTIKIQKFDL